MGKIIRFNKNGLVRKVKNKKRTMIKVITKRILVFIGGFITAILTIMQIYDWIREHRKLDVIIQDEVNIVFFNEDIMQNNNFYPLFGDYVSYDKECLFTENCATQLLVTNHYNNQIVLDKIILNVKEIEIDYSPILFFTYGRNLNDGISVCVNNIGWGEAKNVKVKAVGDSGNLENYFKKEALEFEVASINAAESIEVPFLKNSDILKEFSGWTDVDISFEAECMNGGILETHGGVIPSIYGGRVLYDGLGDGADYVYGIRIDTGKDYFLWEESILEFIDQGETLVFPICFFPDKSCSLKMEIAFEIVNDGKRDIISTGMKEMHFFISSISGCNSIVTYSIGDIEAMSEDGRQFIGNNDIISYPENPAIRIQ